MEQRIDSNTKPEFAAGTDPAYIPGLTAPAPARTEAEPEAEEGTSQRLEETTGEAEGTGEAAVSDALATEAADGSVDGSGADDGDASKDSVKSQDSDTSRDGDTSQAGDAATEGSAASSDDEAATEAESESEASRGGADGEDGPVFEVSDRRGSIRVDAEGVRFRLDDQEAEFDWAEIGAVEVKTGRFGRRFTVTVHLSSRRWFNAEVEAGARSDLKVWTAELDEALDAHFEEEA
ncbi:hypothetical protein [Streptomyces sp. NBC_01012]|uniref:hypothetical protein n=1 Tax=Streptomyces sp. NBC_01012 TaxID=2903717 RepID=UPI0038666FCF|nr:hypothetical protein OG623_07190 [Streptomyces sp. NBC_01012]